MAQSVQLIRVGRQVSAITWTELLASASTPDDVISAARDFVANIDRIQLAKLPEGCKPGKLMDTHDVASYAYDLLLHKCEQRADSSVVDTINKLSAFFSEAVTRLSQLAAPQPANREVVRLFSQ